MMTLHALNLPGGERGRRLTAEKQSTSPEFQKEYLGFPRNQAKEPGAGSLQD
jgi:hypothetical protein